MKSKVNFHIHTIHSDGGKTVFEIVAGLKDAGVTAFAITDHDTVEGNFVASVLAKQYNLTHYNGVEISACFSNEIEGLDETCVCHIVGLDFDRDTMREYILKFEAHKCSMVEQLFDDLISDGYALDKNRVIDENGRISERSSIAMELIRCGHAKNKNSAFADILNKDKYKKYARNLPTIEETINAIHASGGLAIMAHPFGYIQGRKFKLEANQVVDLATALYENGRFAPDGMEVYYQHYDENEINLLKQLSDKYRVLKSIGTDYHHSPVNLIKHPEYAKRLKKETLMFNVENVSVDESILTILASRHNQ